MTKPHGGSRMIRRMVAALPGAFMIWQLAGCGARSEEKAASTSQALCGGAACTPLDRTVSTVITDTSFLFTGTGAPQVGAGGPFDPLRLAVLRGTVTDRNALPLSGVSVKIVGHPEFGSTLTQSNGSFDMAVNGGGVLRARFSLSSYLSVDRTLTVPVQDYRVLDNVVLSKPDVAVTVVPLSASSTQWQTAQGTQSNDTSGTRRATLLIPPGTTAVMRMPDQSTQPLPSMHFRATEFSVGTTGPNALSATLPTGTDYTYALDLGADEARSAGADHIDFSQALSLYVENFLSLPTGVALPYGAYDPQSGSWGPGGNGVVLKILSLTGGLANVDITGDNMADTGAALSNIGLSDLERAQLATLYPLGGSNPSTRSLWRVRIQHFSGATVGLPGGGGSGSGGGGGGGGSGGGGECTPGVCTANDLITQIPCQAAPLIVQCPPGSSCSLCPPDHSNYYGQCDGPVAPGAPNGTDCYDVCCGNDYFAASGTCHPHHGPTPETCTYAPPPGPDPNGPGDCDQPNASTIRCQRQSLGEDIAIAGTPFSLHYESDRQRGHKAQLEIPITSATSPAGLLGVDIRVSVAGTRFMQSFDATPNRTFPYTWDGTDAYGRRVQGAQPVSIELDNRFAGFYQTAQSFGVTGAGTSPVAMSTRQAYKATKAWTGTIGGVGRFASRARRLDPERQPRLRRDWACHQAGGWQEQDAGEPSSNRSDVRGHRRFRRCEWRQRPGDRRRCSDSQLRRHRQRRGRVYC
jgi:hypothetical protein